MEKKIYDERALRAFKADFEKVKANLMHVHECDLGSVGFRSELIVRLYKACDYRCLYRFMPVHEMTVMEGCRLISKCSDYIVRDFVCYFLNWGGLFECLYDCCDALYCDGDFEYDEPDGLDKAEVRIYSEILDLKKPHRWFDGLSDEMKRRFEEDRLGILSRYGYEEDNTITEGRILKLMEWYCLGWKSVLEWVRDKHGLDVLTHFIWDTYVKKDTSAVAKKELEDYIEFCGNGGGWMSDGFEVTIYECREQIRKWFDDPKVRKDFLLGGKDISVWLKEKNTEWRKDISVWLKEKNTEWRKVKRLSNWFHFNGKD